MLLLKNWTYFTPLVDYCCGYEVEEMYNIW